MSAVYMHPTIRKPNDRRAAEREILFKVLTCSKPLKRAYWTLYASVRAERDRPVINQRNSK